MEKSFRGKKHVCSNCNTKFFDLNKEKIICPNCKTEIVMKKKGHISPASSKIKEKVETVDNDIDLSEEVEFNDSELNEMLENDDHLEKEWDLNYILLGP